MLYLNLFIYDGETYIFDLTLTNVVFELFIFLSLLRLFLYLTLTNVVFE